jgi:hypothetical protein
MCSGWFSLIIGIIQDTHIQDAHVLDTHVQGTHIQDTHETINLSFLRDQNISRERDPADQKTRRARITQMATRHAPAP